MCHCDTISHCNDFAWCVLSSIQIVLFQNFGEVLQMLHVKIFCIILTQDVALLVNV